MFTFHSAYRGIYIAGTLLAAVSVFPADAIPATRTVTLFEAQFPSNSLSNDIPTPPSTPTLVHSFSVLGTATRNGNTMTVYGEDIINSEYVEGHAVTTVDGSTLYTWTTGTLSTTDTAHEIYEVGTTAVGFTFNNDSAVGVEPLIQIECNFDSGASSGTGVCTEVVQFSGQSTAQTTAWTGSIIPVSTFEVSVSATATGSATNAAGSVKGGHLSTLFAGTCVVVVLAGVI
ncbi:hypothetical protein LENED_011639 [Lentinula edodes]|uniref:Uncharacterized protein n=1 Tax=Lentinula edodes TaxID=5353 RepID=A0A1Q3EQV8_LENED|nr:hypothetical protein LENED_011639 [Lentinula edodes]